MRPTVSSTSITSPNSIGRSNNRNKPEIKSENISGKNGNIIMPRVQKDQILQQSRVKKMAEVFTPSWICNAQNNLIDNAWFEGKNVFNKEIPNEKINYVDSKRNQ